MPLGFQTFRTTKKGSIVPVRPSPIEINEILLRILSYLSQPKLRTVASRVSRRWNLAARELIQRRVQFDVGDPGSWSRLIKRVTMATNLSVGRILAPELRTQDYDVVRSKEQWVKLMALLDQVDPATTTVGRPGVRQQLRITELIMYVESWWLDGIASQTLFNAAHLTCLTIYMSWFEIGQDYIEWILDQCPNLSSLSLIGCNLGLPDSHNGRKRVKLPGSRNKDRTEAWPLQSLSIKDLHVSLKKLQDLVPRLTELTSFSLVQALHKFWYLSELEDPITSLQFWTTLAQHCVYLKAISCTASHYRVCCFPMQLFPLAVRFGINGRCVSDSNPTWTALLSIHRIENRITALEIIYGNGEPSSNGKVLRRFLCTAIHLLHFKFGKMLPANIIFNQSGGDHLPCRWACRGLKSLSISHLGHLRMNVWSSTRVLFGYLGRVCPELQELSVDVNYNNRCLPLYLSLLTRLGNLRLLQLRSGVSSYHHLRENEILLRSDFAWLQLNNPETKTWRALKGVPHNPLFSLFNSLALVGNERPEKSLIDCIDTAQAATEAQDKIRVCSLKKMPPLRPYATDCERQVWENLRKEPEKRSRMLQQQKENNYRTDYGQDTPMVDGLVGFDFLGSNLDVEACLQARLWRLQQMYERENRAGPELIQCAATETNNMVEYTRAWQNMEQLLFIISVHGDCPKKLKLLENRIRRTCSNLGRMRPDIEFLCQVRKNIE